MNENMSYIHNKDGMNESESDTTVRVMIVRVTFTFLWYVHRWEDCADGDIR
jgi:hypothetical protein